MSNVNPYEPPSQGTRAPSVLTLPVRASGVLTSDDAITALRIVGKWRVWVGSLVVAVLIGVVGIAHAWIQPAPIDWIWPMLFWGVMAVSALFLPLQAKHRFAKTWNARPENQSPITWSFSEEGLYVETARSKHLHSWEAFDGTKVAREQLVLVQNGGEMFNFIPRRFFESEAAWNAACQLVASRVSMRQAGSSPHSCL